MKLATHEEYKREITENDFWYAHQGILRNHVNNVYNADPVLRRIYFYCMCKREAYDFTGIYMFANFY